MQLITVWRTQRLVVVYGTTLLENQLLLSFTSNQLVQIGST